MKRLIAMLILAVVISAFGGAGVASAIGSGTDLAKGTVNDGFTKWVFDARSSANGIDPHGRIRVTFQNLDPNTVMTAEVRCLRVAGGVFEARGVITDIQGTDPFFLPSTVVTMHGEDSGKFSPDPDTFFGVVTNATDPEAATRTCPAPTPGFQPVEDGEIIVEDN